MPVLTSAQNQYGVVTVYFFPMPAPNLYVQDGTVKIAGKHKVTATAENQGVQISGLSPGQCRGQVIHAGNPDQITSPCRNRECIQLTQISMLGDPQRAIQANRPRISSSKP